MPTCQVNRQTRTAKRFVLGHAKRYTPTRTHPFDRHAGRMDHPQYIRDELPVDSGAMESLCKQLGLRIKGPGMRWSTRNVSAMACLVARWAVDSPRAVRED